MLLYLGRHDSYKESCRLGVDFHNVLQLTKRIQQLTNRIQQRTAARPGLGVDFHNVLHVRCKEGKGWEIPQPYFDALLELQRKFEVHIITFCGWQNYARRYQELADTGLIGVVDEDKIHFVFSRCGSGGKLEKCKALHVSYFIDDSADILEELREGGVTVFPINSTRETYPDGYDSFLDAVELLMYV